MDNFKNLVNCYTCGTSDGPIASLKVEYSREICDLLKKNDIFLKKTSTQRISSWNNCYHCLKLICDLNLLISKQVGIVEQIKTKIATEEDKKKAKNLSETSEIKEEEEAEEEEYKSEPEFETGEFFCKIEVDPDPDESNGDDDEDEDPLTLQTSDPPTPTEQATSSTSFTLTDLPPTTIQPRRPKSPPSPQVCPTCNKLFRGHAAKSRLRHHIDQVHGKLRKFPCPYCPSDLANFATKQLWIRHLLQKHEVSTPQKPLACTFCPKKFAISQLYQRHISNHARLDATFPFFCDTCDTRFKSEAQLTSHTLKSCPLLETLKEHKRIYPCSVCPSTKFYQPVKLALHQRSHHPDLLTFTCATCGSLHLTESHLATHSLLHSDADAYSCLVCKRATFKTKDDLSLHLSTNHTGEETVPCGVSGCPALFSNIAGKLQHMGGAHNEAVFPCASCAEKFVTLSAKIAHEGRAHKDAGVEAFPCEWAGCGKVLETRAALGRHVRLLHKRVGHRTCEICGKELSTPASYRDHIKIHEGVKDILCETCGKGFSCKRSLEFHRVTHTGERPYKCKLCEKAYTQRHVLTTHVRKMHGGDGEVNKN